MSLLLTCRIRIGQIEYTRTSGVEIESSWKSLGDSATIKLYGFCRVQEFEGDTEGVVKALEELVAVGDPVTVELGYDGELRTEFQGYVAGISAGFPFELRCEDEIFHLKRTRVNRTWQDTTLIQLLRDLVPTVQLSDSVPKMEIDSFRADRTTVAGVLKKLKEAYPGLCAYFRNGRLFVGLTYTEFTSASQVEGSEALYSFQQNIIEDNLSYQRKEDVRIKAHVVAMHPNGKKTTAEAGDMDGEERTITLRTPSTDKSQLAKMAESELAKFKYEGYRGDFTGFGVPYAIHSGVADLLDTKHSERGGRYLIDGVRVSFGPDGFRRKLMLGKRASY